MSLADLFLEVVQVEKFPKPKTLKNRASTNKSLFYEYHNGFGHNEGLLQPSRYRRTTNKRRKTSELCHFPKESKKEENIPSKGRRQTESEKLENLGT